MKTVKLSCFHTHTDFCDGKGDIESFCSRALEKGFCSLGFSSHAPIEKKTGIVQKHWNMMEHEGRLEKYIEAVNAAKKAWEGRLRIFLGLEVEYIPGLVSPSDEYYQKLGLDYVIGAVHYVLPSKGRPFAVDNSFDKVKQGIQESYGGDPMAVVDDYFKSVEKLITEGGFDFLAHPDLIKKHNSNNRLFNADSSFYGEKCKTAASLAGNRGITIEINTGGINRGYIETPYPSLSFLEMFRKNSVPAMINADAHNPEELDGYYGLAIETMLAAGYKKTVLFEGRKNNCPVWTEENL